MEKNPANTGGSYKWREIADLPQDVRKLRDRELDALWQGWTRQRETLAQAQSVSQFNLELRREWAVETGIIEGVYTLNKGVTKTLIERGIEARHIPRDARNSDPELVARIIQAHADVLEGLFAFVKGDRALSTSYIKELHAALLRHVDKVTVYDPSGRAYETKLRKGDYKTLPNSPSREDGSVHEYCPPEHVSSEMDRLIALHEGHGEVRPEVEAAWLHHAFTQIQPFQDGNGRVARTIASLVFIKAGLFPLVVTWDDREKYYGGLEAADTGDLRPLVDLFSTLQKRLITKAIGLAVDLKPAANVDEAIDATRDLLVALNRIVPASWLAAKQHAGRLFQQTQQVFSNMTVRLNGELSRVDPSFQFQVGQLGAPPAEQILALSKRLKYDPDFAQFHMSIQVSLKGPSGKAVIVVSFHGLGATYRGLLAVVAYFQMESKDPVALADDIFRISFEDQSQDLASRFAKWLDACLVNGIACWRRTLV